jgi:hypothetical protein
VSDDAANVYLPQVNHVRHRCDDKVITLRANDLRAVGHVSREQERCALPKVMPALILACCLVASDIAM